MVHLCVHNRVMVYVYACAPSRSAWEDVVASGGKWGGVGKGGRAMGRVTQLHAGKDVVLGRLRRLPTHCVAAVCACVYVLRMYVYVCLYDECTCVYEHVCVYVCACTCLWLCVMLCVICMPVYASVFHLCMSLDMRMYGFFCAL